MPEPREDTGNHFVSDPHVEPLSVQTDEAVIIARTTCGLFKDLLTDLPHKDALCCTCLDQTKPEEEGIKIVLCEHFFHKVCVYSHCTHSPLCPLCRKEMTPMTPITLVPPNADLFTQEQSETLLEVAT